MLKYPSPVASASVCSLITRPVAATASRISQFTAHNRARTKESRRFSGLRFRLMMCMGRLSKGASASDFCTSVASAARTALLRERFTAPLDEGMSLRVGRRARRCGVRERSVTNRGFQQIFRETYRGLKHFLYFIIRAIRLHVTLKQHLGAMNIAIESACIGSVAQWIRRGSTD